MSVASMVRATIRHMPAEQKLAATLTNGAQTIAVTVLDGVVKSEQRRYDSGTLIQGGMREFALLAAGLAFAPVIGMQLTLGGVPWSIMDVGVMEPTDQGTPILYRLAAER